MKAGKTMAAMAAAMMMATALGCQAQSGNPDVGVLATASAKVSAEASRAVELDKARRDAEQAALMKSAIEEKGLRTAEEVAAKEEPVAEPAAPAEPIEQEWQEPVYEETVYVEEWQEPQQAQEYAGGTDLQRDGVVYGDDGTRYTWYSERVLPGGGLDELNSNGRAVNGDGYVVDGDGYIAVASSDHEQGTVLDTPWGEAKVYDTGCDSGTVDVYTNWG